MSPDVVRRAALLDEQHRLLQLELKAWQGLFEPPPIVEMSMPTYRTTAGVDVNAWHRFREATIVHVRRAIETNRAAYEAL